VTAAAILLTVFWLWMRATAQVCADRGERDAQFLSGCLAGLAFFAAVGLWLALAWKHFP
jgi:hypothetical protein